MVQFKLAFITLGILSFCSAEAKFIDGDTRYDPPTVAVEVDGDEIFDASYDDTWRAVVAHLSDTSFVVDTMDKESGFISVSFAVKDPRSVIDCGKWTMWVKNLRGRREYSFDGASAHATFETLSDGTLMQIERNVSLSGKFNILTTSLSEHSSRVKVTTRYVPQVSQTVSNYQVDSNFRRAAPVTSTDSFSFNTGQEAHVPGAQTVCRANGQLERGLLDGVSQSLEQ